MAAAALLQIAVQAAKFTEVAVVRHEAQHALSGAYLASRRRTGRGIAICDPLSCQAMKEATAREYAGLATAKRRNLLMVPVGELNG